MAATGIFAKALLCGIFFEAFLETIEKLQAADAIPNVHFVEFSYHDLLKQYEIGMAWGLCSCENKPLECGWQERENAQDQIYYYNTETDQSQWERPSDYYTKERCGDGCDWTANKWFTRKWEVPDIESASCEYLNIRHHDHQGQEDRHKIEVSF